MGFFGCEEGVVAMVGRIRRGAAVEVLVGTAARIRRPVAVTAATGGASAVWSF